jgi:hypothetical protein
MQGMNEWMGMLKEGMTDAARRSTPLIRLSRNKEAGQADGYLAACQLPSVATT